MCPSQIPLDLPFASSQAREDLVVSRANALAVRMIDNWPDWPGHLVVLAGPVGSGKSHIAGIWAAMADAEIVPAAALSAGSPPTSHNIVIEDADSGSVAERALFHLINHVRAQDGHCLITSRRWPAEWEITLPDLVSRLKAAQLVELAEPDDELLRQVIFKLFSDRQLAFDPGVVEYLTNRMERSLESANRLVAEIDRESLALNRRITRKTAAAVMKRIGMV